MRIAIVLLAFLAADVPPPPDTPKRPVTDEYHGVKVTDDYRWLEDSSNPEVRAWSDAQNARTRAYLDAAPLRAGIAARLKQLYTGQGPSFSGLSERGGILFAMENAPPKAQPMLVRLASIDDPGAAQPIVDPNALDPDGSTSIDFFVPSLDGKLVAVSISKGGSEDGTLAVFETATGKRLPDSIPRVNEATAGGSVAWNADSSGFWYTRYPRPGERPPADRDFYQQVWFHRLGAGADTYALGKELPRIAEITMQGSDDGKFVLIKVANGDGGEYLHYIMSPPGEPAQITRISDQTSLAAFGPNGALYLMSNKDAPMGKLVLASPPRFLFADAKPAVTTGRSFIDGFLPVGPHLYVRYMAGGPSRLLDKTAGSERVVNIPPISSIDELARVKGQMVFEDESYVDPPAWYRYDPATGAVAKTALALKSAADFSDAEVVRQVAISKDGTHVPLNIVRRKGTRLDGNNPLLLTGYGGYGIPEAPAFSERTRLWLDHGGVWVDANLRGGSEFGETWREQGQLAKKQNVFDDFLACAEYLIKAKYTNPAKLAIEGWSNGGLLMGAALTQRPDLYRAVVSHVGIYDMLRAENFPNGAFNVTEYGTVKEAEQFKALYAYSPYHHVKDATDYPAVMFLTGANDGRVDPMNSRKMTARLQAATHSGRLILLRTSANSGHGFGTALQERIEEDADVFAFLFDQLGMK
ncbi:MAG TPA: prolyl oligopeptidase family serine peptidase [Bryobacteraceae bacterium]|nr:prolyl oligopeptidase family serine peptidase [Bryobacteraceae bacterium]